ncbi:hypothetical protein BpHYR1_014599 [Brachionus plicatilis]|uniref:Uncharacterized protein n=1 Tax=Brachionus plicatilis TaxID=10195 RepID=A0A3M7PV67_BRAPC|nr:hypothetical protein BpHYR1_014599 [Brachionus plicatilis]
MFLFKQQTNRLRSLELFKPMSRELNFKQKFWRVSGLRNLFSLKGLTQSYLIRKKKIALS